VRAVLFTIGAEGGMNLAQAQEVRDALVELRRAGKKTIVFADTGDVFAGLDQQEAAVVAQRYAPGHRGTLRLADLEKLPRVRATYLLQCGAQNPRGIVTWEGVRFSDFAGMLGLHPGVHYGRFVSVDGMYVDEDMTTLRHRQVMLAWMMNGQTLSADHGAPLRLIVPFRYGNRSIKAIAEISFGTPGLPFPPAPLPTA